MSQNDLLEKLKDIAGESQVRTDEPMSSHTTFRIGGTADYFVMPSSVEELQTIIRLLKKSDINYYVIGNGSNLLVGDKGFRGVIIQLSDAFDEVEYIDDVTVKAMSGMKLSRLGNRLSDKGLAGFEFATGIPGTIGGAVRMNAGAYGGEFKDIVISTKCIDITGNIIELANKEQNFSYRHSAFMNNNLIIIQSKLMLDIQENQDEIKQKMDENLNARKSKQPINMPNAGSTFKRGSDFITAKLIDECGLKGYTIGGAQISDVHAGFVVNTGNATAEDVLSLVDYVKNKVYEKFKKEIQLEVEVIGE